MSSGDPETRKRILNETWRLMEERRGQGVNISDIARAAGVSRQAVYLHFGTRPELLVATVRHVDEMKNIDQRLQALKTTGTGVETLEAFVNFWGNYIPEIYGLAKSLLAVRETDQAANIAWEDRMEAMREGCRCVVECLVREKNLAPGWQPAEAVDMMWAMLSIAIWENLTLERGWSSGQYIQYMQFMLKRVFLAV
jgi:AcrR family transcriptional regulator